MVSTQGGTYDEGTSVSVTANPSDGYGFGGWTNLDSNQRNVNITVSQNLSIEANFIELPHIVILVHQLRFLQKILMIPFQ